MTLNLETSGGHSQLMKRAAVVASGHAIGSVLTVAVLPILTRVYSPDAFGVMAVFLALATVTATIATLRFDQAIPLPTQDRTAASLAVLASASAAASAVLLLAVAALWKASIDNAVRGFPLPPDFAVLLAAGIAAIAVYQITSSWMIRDRHFTMLAKTRIVYVVATLALQLLYPLAIGSGPVGLISGQIAGFGLAGVFAAWCLRRTSARLPLRQAQRLDHLMVEYRNFPLFDVWATLATNVALFGPAVLLAVFFGAEVAGWFTLAHRLIATPLALVSNSVSRVYYAEAARAARQDGRALLRLFRNTLSQLALMVAPPVVAVAAVAPFTFGSILGSKWQQVGIYVCLLAPLVLAFVMSFVVGPTLDAIGRQRRKFLREITCTVLIVVGIVVPGLLGWTPTQAVAMMSVLGTLGYVLAIAVTWRSVRDQQLGSEEGKFVPVRKVA